MSGFYSFPKPAQKFAEAFEIKVNFTWNHGDKIIRFWTNM